MRISTNYQYESLLFDVQSAQERVAATSAQLATGKRINRPMDDPVGVGQTINARALSASMQQFQRNLGRAQSTLGFNDSTAGDMHDLMVQAYQLAVQGANSSTDQAGRNAMAAQISGIQSRLLDLANTKGPTGDYLFAGHKSSTKPYTLVGNTLTFNGDTNPIFVEAGPGQTIQTNVASEPMITNMYNRLETLKSDLTGGQMGAISGVDIAQIQASMDELTSTRGVIGARVQSINDLTSQWQRRSDELTKTISDVEDVDMSAAVVQYQQANQAYTAALTVAGQGFRLSLMDFIK